MTQIKDLKEQKQQFGEFVKDRRASLGMSLRGLAGELGIAPSYLSDIEKGKRNPPVGDLLNRFIEALKLDGEMEWYLCELVGIGREELAPDMVEFLKSNEAVRDIVRKFMAVSHNIDSKVMDNEDEFFAIHEAISKIK